MIANTKKVLVVDDDADIREIMTWVLEEEGYKVASLDRGAAAVSTVETMHPDIVLLDVMLGDMDGRDICKTLKQDDDTRNIPVIIVSASHGAHTAHQKNCGADQYLDKPFDISELVSQVKRLAA